MIKPVLYTTGCPKCKVISAKLSKAGIEYEICNDIPTMQSKGFTQAPVLEIGERTMEFAEILKWIGERR